LNNDLKIGLGYDSLGQNSFQLQQGPDYDNFNMYISIEISDNFDANFIFSIATPIAVRPNPNTASLLSSLVDQQPGSSLNQILHSGNTQQVLKTIGSLTSSLNSLSFSDSNAQSEGGAKFVGYGPFQGVSYESNFDDIKSLKNAGSYKGANESQTQSGNSSKYEENRLARSKMRDSLLDHLANASISGVSGLKMWSGILATVTQSVDEVSRQSSDASMSLCVRLANSMSSVSSQTSIESLQQISNGLINTIGNTLSVSFFFFWMKDFFWLVF
jgi:hypothetical protein